MVFDRVPVESDGNSSISDLTIVEDMDLEGEWSTKEGRLSVETPGGVGDEVWAARLSAGRRRLRWRSIDIMAERTEKEGSMGSRRRKVVTSSPGPTGEEGGGVENTQ